MGSGHFVVAMFERLVALRLAEEKLDEVTAVVAVIRENIVRFGDRPALHADWRLQPRAGRMAARRPSSASGYELGLLWSCTEHP